MRPFLTSTAFFLFFAGAFASGERESHELCLNSLVPPRSLEELYPGTGLQLFQTERILPYVPSIDDLAELHRALGKIGDKVVPKASWLGRIEERLRQLEGPFIAGILPAAEFNQMVSAILYEASVATHIPSEQIFIDEDIVNIARKYRQTRDSGRKAGSKHKDINLAWFANDRLIIVEAKSLSPFFWSRNSPSKIDEVMQQILEQSKTLRRALKSFDLKFVSYLVIRNLPPEQLRFLKSRGLAYDHVIEFDPPKTDRFLFSEEN